MGIIFSVVLLFVMIAALVDIIMREDSQVRGLPKLVWVLLVVIVPLVGSIVWFAVGHDWSQHRGEAVAFGDPRRQDVVVERRAAAMSDTEAQLAALEAEEKAERIRQLEAQLEAKRSASPES